MLFIGLLLMGLTNEEFSIDTKVHILVPRDTVWNVLTDQQQLVKWHHEVKSVQQIEGDSFSQGARYLLKLQKEEGEETAYRAVLASHPQDSLALIDSTRHLTKELNYTLLIKPNYTTEIKAHVIFRPMGLINRIAMRWRRTGLKYEATVELENFRDYLENREKEK